VFTGPLMDIAARATRPGRNLSPDSPKPFVLGSRKAVRPHLTFGAGMV